MNTARRDIDIKKMNKVKKDALQHKYEQLLKDNGGLVSQIEQAQVENPQLEELLKKDRNRFFGGCG